MRSPGCLLVLWMVPKVSDVMPLVHERYMADMHRRSEAGFRGYGIVLPKLLRRLRWLDRAGPESTYSGNTTAIPAPLHRPPKHL